MTKTKAIILHKSSFKESSYLVKLLTNDQGIISAIVQGAKRKNSKYQAHFEIGNLLEVVLLKKQTSSLYLITDSTLIKFIDPQSITFPQLIYIQSALEIYSQLIISPEDSSDHFNLLEVYIDYIPRVKNNHILIYWRFLLKLADLLGYPLTHFENNQYKFMTDSDFLLNYSHDTLLIVNKWLSHLPNASILINSDNIIDKDCLIMNSFLINWFEYHLHKKIEIKAIELMIGLNE